MADPQQYRDKVRKTFEELAPDRASRLLGLSAPEIKAVISRAIAPDFVASVAEDIAFHLTDWSEDAAFLVALHLYPERLSPAEIRAGVIDLIVHAPNHLAAAAKLAGHPIEDVFGLGELVEDSS